jgi:nitrite reductase/ring-hydroxylating ferredoxin subunit
MEYLVASESTLKQKKKMKVVVKNKTILLTMTENGIFAIQDKCPHRGSSLLSGKFDNGVIVCKDHGLPISVETGEVTDQKKADFLKLDEYSLSVRKFKTVLKEGNVFIIM